MSEDSKTKSFYDQIFQAAALMSAITPEKKESRKRKYRLLWNSSRQGTYIKKLHGELK